MIRANILPPLAGVRMVPFLAPPPEGEKRLFQNVPFNEYAGLIEQVSPEEAEILIIPHEYAAFRKHPKALPEYVATAKKYRKKILISAYQDDPSPIHIDNAVILRASAYKKTLLKNEVCMPAYVEDLGAAYGAEPLQKQERPCVGFVGKAGFKDGKEAIKYLLRNYLTRTGVMREGVYFRQRAMRLLKKDTNITTRFLARTSFSAHRESIELSPDRARKEYVENIQNSLLTLSPRGDGNFSLRFYETLSLGRIPLLIDTDMPLPLEDRIQYDNFIVRVPWQDIEHVGEYVHKFFKASNEELVAKQKQAREVFVQYLYMPAFLSTVLSNEYIAKRNHA